MALQGDSVLQPVAAATVTHPRDAIDSRALDEYMNSRLGPALEKLGVMAVGGKENRNPEADAKLEAELNELQGKCLE